MKTRNQQIPVRRLLEELEKSFYDGGLTISDILKILSISRNFKDNRSEGVKNLIDFLRKGEFIEISDFDKKSFNLWLDNTKTVGKVGNFIDSNNMRINISTKGMEYLTLLRFNERADRSNGIMLVFTTILISIAFIQILNVPLQNVSPLVWTIISIDVIILLFAVFFIWNLAGRLFHRN